MARSVSAPARYEVSPVRKFEDGTLAGWSAVLSLELRLIARRLRFFEPHTGEELPNSAEAEDNRNAAGGRRREAAARRVAETRLQEEVAARKAAEARVAELDALLHREKK